MVHRIVHGLAAAGKRKPVTCSVLASTQKQGFS
jgi:hypothetical protein